MVMQRDARQAPLKTFWFMPNCLIMFDTDEIKNEASHINLDINSTISIDCSNSLNLNSITGTGSSTLNSNNEASCNVITNNSTGYSLRWNTTQENMENSNSDTILAYTPNSTNTPETWNVETNDSEWGARLKHSGSTDQNDSEWGTTDNYVSGKWLNISTSPREIVQRSNETDPAGSNEIIQFGAEIGASKLQPTGTYTVDVVMTAVTL